MVYIVIKHNAYRRKLISKGNIACIKRHSERAGAKLLVNMGRLTNPSYNFLAESEISTKCLSVRNYIVFFTPSEFNKPATGSSFRKGSPKLILRRKRTEFAITRNSKEWGLRRVRSTAASCRKGPSHVRFDKDMLSGVYASNQLDLLRSCVISNKKCNNLSIIMSDPNFLIFARTRVHSNSEDLILIKNRSAVLDEGDLAWFQKTANTIRNGVFQFSPSKRTYASGLSRKKRPLVIIHTLKDKIIQEAMCFLLTLVFENDFSKNAHGWATGRGCHMALNQIKMRFARDHWFIKGDTSQQPLRVNRQVLVKLLKTKIADQAFIDLIYKYLKAGYLESFTNRITQKSLGIDEREVLSFILLNIYLTPFDKWIESNLIPKYSKEKEKKVSRTHAKVKCFGQVTDNSMHSLLQHDRNYTKLHYVRYADSFVIGFDGPKIYCKQIVEECRIFLLKQLKLILNTEKTKIIHSQSDSVKFLGYRVYKTKLFKTKTAFNLKSKFTSRTAGIVLDGPVDQIVDKLKQRGYANKKGLPVRNGKFINHSLYDIIKHYKNVERDILRYYKLANNYTRVATRIHYILKYSCALTIASKMKLTTLRRVFNKYGKNLNIKNQLGKIIINYPAVDYRRPKRSTMTHVQDHFR